MYPFLALAAAALAVVFWRIAVRIVLIVILFLLILGLATLMGQPAHDQGSTAGGTTAAGRNSAQPR